MGREMEFMLVLLPARQVDGDDFMILYRTRTVVSSWTMVLFANKSLELDLLPHGKRHRRGLITEANDFYLR